VNDICRKMKPRLKDIDLPLLYSPHSFRVTTITDFLEQGVQLEDVATRRARHASRGYTTAGKGRFRGILWRGFLYEATQEAVMRFFANASALGQSGNT
jgi:hypothetical protein